MALAGRGAGQTMFGKDQIDSGARPEDGRYRQIVRDVFPLQLDEAKRVDLPSGRGILRGRAGDWVVDYGGDGDMAVVAADTFAATYEVLDTPVPLQTGTAASEQKSA